ncbi:MAG TPA: phosphorylase [Candidatus Lokiarchaeia archaeon]|nr:phosphorylase [Candidatus Lokiarchaeia archaeon]
MRFEELLLGHFKYGTKPEDILHEKDYDRIRKNVVLAPWWTPDIFEGNNMVITQINNSFFDIVGEDFAFSYLRTGLGAPAVLEYVLPLGVTACENLIFIGAVGSLDQAIKIGDIVIPSSSICGNGTSRYLNTNLEDDFGKEEYPDEALMNRVKNYCDTHEIKYYTVKNFSIDTIFAQFAHIEKILEYGCQTIEMETAAVFKAARICNIKAMAIFCVSDNTITKKSIFSGRTEAERIYQRKQKKDIIPSLLKEIYKCDTTD